MWFELGGQTLQVNGTDRQATRWMAEELAFHRVSTPNGPTRVSLRFDSRGAIGGGGWQHYSRRLVARWRYRVEMSDQLVAIEAYGTRLSIPLVFHMLVSPAVRLMSARSGSLMLHSGTVSENGQSIMFAGKGGAGKTTTTSMLLQKGGQNRGLQSDDYTFFSNGVTLPFVTRSHLYGDLLEWVPEIRSSLTRAEVIRARAFQTARNWSGGALRWPVRVPQHRLWGERTVDGKARPRLLLVLERGEVEEPTLLQTSSSKAASFLLEMNFGEASRFIELLAKQYGEAWTASLVSEWRELEQELIGQLVRSVPVKALVMPRSLAAGGSKSILQELDAVLSAEPGSAEVAL